MDVTPGGLMLDLVIRRGTLIDGTGAPRRTADVGVAGGKVVAVGKIDEQAERTVDADGALVAPGFVDIHTHYDGQATWDSRLQPSSGHGVTTVVMGNCGVGFAPVHDGDHAQLIELMEGVEDIPGAALHEGLPWDWHSIADYLDALERRPHDIDFAAQVCHGPIRLFVMGQRGADREPATAEEIAEMGRLTAEGVRAGALGFTTSRTLNHRTSKGEPTPTLTAAREELVGIARALGEAGAGVMEVVSDWPEVDDESGTLLEMMRVSGRPLSVSLASARGYDHRRILELLTAANDEGLRMRAQVPARGIGVLVGLQATVNPLKGSPTFQALGDVPVHELALLLADPAVREKVIAEWSPLSFLERGSAPAAPPDYEPSPEQSVAARAGRLGIDPRALL